jgi:RNA polymerase sigma-70 factor, ECF subfamily
MRRVLIDHAKARCAQKRGGGAAVVQLDDAMAAPEQRVDDLLALNEALERSSDSIRARSKSLNVTSSPA